MLPNRDRYAPLERIFIDKMRANLAGNWTDGAALMRRARELAPQYAVTEGNLGISSLEINRPGDLVEAFGRADFQPMLKYKFGIMQSFYLAQAHHMLGNYSAELAEVHRGQQHYPDDLILRRQEARALIALGRLDDLKRLVEDSLSRTAEILFNPGDVLLDSATELRAHGHREESFAMARRAASWARARTPDAAGSPANSKVLGRALFLAEEWDEARAVFAELAAKDAKDIVATGYLGVIGARKGDRVAARAASDRLRRLKQRFLFGQHTLWRAAISAQLDDKNAAVDLLREAFAQGLDYSVWLHRHVPLEPLRGYPPFDALVRPKK